MSLVGGNHDAEEIGVTRVGVLLVMGRIGCSEVYQHIPSGSFAEELLLSRICRGDFDYVALCAPAGFQKDGCCTKRIKRTGWIVLRKGKEELIDFGEIRGERFPPVTITVVKNSASAEDLLDADSIFADHPDDHVGQFVGAKGLVYDRAHGDIASIVFGIVNGNLLRQGHSESVQ